MGKAMAQGTGLTSRQKQFLAVVLQETYILKKFYLTGGTVLNSWYLHHRESYDIDLFSEQEVNVSHIGKWLTRNKRKIGFSSIRYEQQLGFYFFYLTFPNNEELKVDFCYFPSERIERGLIWRGLHIDSLYDIAVNKLQTIGMSPRGRDYVDLYCILKKQDWTIEQINRDSGIKHGMHIESTQLANQFLKVVEFADLPTMLVPFNRKGMDAFFLAEAKKLEKDIFK